jgi:predicted transcriptional regulator
MLRTRGDKMPTKKDVVYVKTSIKLREDLWKKASHLAVERRSELQIIVNEALELYLQTKGGSK